MSALARRVVCHPKTTYLIFTCVSFRVYALHSQRVEMRLSFCEWIGWNIWTISWLSTWWCSLKVWQRELLGQKGKIGKSHKFSPSKLFVFAHTHHTETGRGCNTRPLYFVEEDDEERSRRRVITIWFHMCMCKVTVRCVRVFNLHSVNAWVRSYRLCYFTYFTTLSGLIIHI